MQVTVRIYSVLWRVFLAGFLSTKFWSGNGKAGLDVVSRTFPPLLEISDVRQEGPARTEVQPRRGEAQAARGVTGGGARGQLPGLRSDQRDAAAQEPRRPEKE